MLVGLRQAARGPRGLELTLAPSLQKFCTVAAPNKCLAQSNKSRIGCTATKKRHQQYAVSTIADQIHERAHRSAAVSLWLDASRGQIGTSPRCRSNTSGRGGQTEHHL